MSGNRTSRKINSPKHPIRTDDGVAGTTDQLPRWEGPPENRPAGYLPAEDDPSRDRDAAGENLRDPDKRDLSDALKTQDDS